MLIFHSNIDYINLFKAKTIFSIVLCKVLSQGGGVSCLYYFTHTWLDRLKQKHFLRSYLWLPFISNFRPHASILKPNYTFHRSTSITLAFIRKRQCLHQTTYFTVLPPLHLPLSGRIDIEIKLHVSQFHPLHLKCKGGGTVKHTKVHVSQLHSITLEV